jgi:predicted ATPase
MPSPHSTSKPGPLPFLRTVQTRADRVQADRFPFSIPIFKSGIDLHFTRNVTFFVGENGSGKSTLLEAIAVACGFNILGGSRNHNYGTGTEHSELAPALRLAWNKKTTQGFFMRAESFFNFATYIDQLEEDDPGLLPAYGGKSLHQQSHGEAFLSLFQNRFAGGIYLLDEPEAALSPQRQLALLRIIHDLDRSGEGQFLIATHSPLLFSYPDATVLSLDGGSIRTLPYYETDHYLLTKRFLESPERYFSHLFRDE